MPKGNGNEKSIYVICGRTASAENGIACETLVFPGVHQKCTAVLRFIKNRRDTLAVREVKKAGFANKRNAGEICR